MAVTVGGRSCGTCTLCCKLLEIPETDSAKGAWCRHCKPGKGCAIYAERPGRCRQFMCGWLVWDKVPEHWHPAKSRIVIASEDGARLHFAVDPGAPGRWREAPWYQEIKAMAVLAFAENRQVLVSIGNRVIAMLPDREVDLGMPAPDEIIVTGRRPDGSWGAARVHRDDPRLTAGGSLPAGSLIPLN